MSASRFVSSGNADTSLDKEDAWAKAQAAVDAAKVERQQTSRQEGGADSLYDVLQRNKAAKQEAFEESIKLKNQFKALEEDDIEFLDSVLEKERERNEAVKRETRDQLEAFRKQQRDTDGKQDPSEDQPATATEPQRMWTGGKKRKRQKDGDAVKGVKSHKPTTHPSNSTNGPSDSPSALAAPAASSPPQDDPANRPSDLKPEKLEVKPDPPKPKGLGLTAYEDSDDD